LMIDQGAFESVLNTRVIAALADGRVRSRP
jgi:hypothetical protein